MSKLKTMYVYEVLVPTKVKKQTTKEKDGQEVTEIVTVTEDKPRRAALRKPTRALFDDAELYFNVMVSEGIKAGLMSRALLAKRYSNDGGAMSDPEKKLLEESYSSLGKKQDEFMRLSMKEESAKSEEEKKRSNDLIGEIANLRKTLQDLEMSQLSLYDITAESRARSKTILWWILHLAYKESLTEPEVWEPIFKGDTVQEKMEAYDAIEEGEDLSEEDKSFYFKATRRAAAATAFWYYGQAAKQEDFKQLEADINRDTEDTPKQEAPVAPKEEAPAPENKE